MENQRLVQPQAMVHFGFVVKNPANYNFICSADDGNLFEKGVARATNALQPQCYRQQKLAKMRIVKDQMKESYGIPFLYVRTG